MVAVRKAEGQTQLFEVDCYFESGYRGSLRVTIKDGLIENVEDMIKASLFQAEICSRPFCS